MKRSHVQMLALLAGLAGCDGAGAPTDAVVVDGPAYAKEARSPRADEAAKDAVVRFERFVGNDVTGAGGAIRGQNAGGIPWRLDHGEARLAANGELRVKVEGLVLQTTGLNPVPAFKAILSCLTNSGSTLATVNVSTAPVPVGPDGDAEIREVLDGVPTPCYAPVVLVTSGGGSWFAASGF